MTKRNGGSSIRVLLAAASAVRRAGLEALIKNAPSLELAGSLESTRHLQQHVRDLAPDIVLLDLERAHGELSSQAPMVVLIDQPDPGWAAQALRSGVKGIVPRDAEVEIITAAIQAARSGVVLLDADVSAALAARIRPPADSRDTTTEELTPREIEVLGMLAEGLGNRDIADRLGISNHTVKFHISSILDKLGATSRTEAVTLGLRKGLILL
ncbi:MAG TPA: response regulator transcription factor [Terriglobales bacterium]|nr:response regulator transcription factor [Terriglobales bacterium]